MPEERRRAIIALYAFCREVDDVVDETSEVSVARMKLAWWRTERQSFISLPGNAQAVCTIHVEIEPLATAIDSADKALRLRDAIATMSDAVLAYRSLSTVREPLLAWLAARAA